MLRVHCGLFHQTVSGPRQLGNIFDWDDLPLTDDSLCWFMRDKSKDEKSPSSSAEIPQPLLPSKFSPLSGC